MLYSDIYGLMTCNFTSLLTVFQSYQDDKLLITKGYAQWNPVLRMERSSPQAGLEPGTARSAGQRLPTGAPFYSSNRKNKNLVEYVRLVKTHIADFSILHYVIIKGPFALTVV